MTTTLCNNSKCNPYKTSHLITEIFEYENVEKEMITDTLGHKLYTARINKGIGLKRMASMLGISNNTLNRWEKSETYPPLEYLPVLANALDVSVDSLKDEYVEFIENLPKEIKNIKLKLNLSTEELALKVGITNLRTLKDWTSGRHIPNTKTIKKLIQFKKAAD